MGRVITNGVSLQYAREASLGVLPGAPAWIGIEPNTISAFGTVVSKTSRTPISRFRARRKGVVTDANSDVTLDADFTMQHWRDFMEGFTFSIARGADVFLPTASAAGAFTVPALTAAQAGRLTYGAGAAKSLIMAMGFTVPANNGLKILSALPATGAVSIPVVAATAAGTVPVVEVIDVTDIIELGVAGVRGAPGDLKIDAAGNLISTVLDFTLLGLVIGQQVYIGGLDIANNFFNPANVGFARIAGLAQHKITLAKRDQAFALDDGTSTGAGGAALAIDILFGQFVRNVDVTSADYQEIPYQFELASPNLMPGPATGYEYAVGFYADSIDIKIPLAGKITATMTFKGKNVVSPSAARATNAATGKSGGRTAAFGTSSDIARMRVEDVDETGLTTDFADFSITIKNSVDGEKVLGTLGPKYLNVGSFEVDITAKTLFSNPNVVERIRCNRTVGLDFVIRNGDGGIAFDLPTGTISGGGREYPQNKSVLINSPFQAYQDDAFGYTLGASFFPALPTTACS